MDNTQYFPQLHKISQAKITLGEILSPTPLASNPYLSGKFGADVMLKREDLQIVRSYKIRGAYNKIRNLSEPQRKAGVVCASAFSYTKKTSKERGPVVIGIELSHPDDFNTLVAKMEENGFAYEYLNDKPLLFEFLV